jgi:hypothetical protein
VNRDERKAAGLGIGVFFWLALLGVGWLAGPVVGWIWTVLVVGITMLLMLSGATKR